MVEVRHLLIPRHGILILRDCVELFVLCLVSVSTWRCFPVVGLLQCNLEPGRAPLNSKKN
jgi:hypothetical protein